MEYYNKEKYKNYNNIKYGVEMGLVEFDTVRIALHLAHSTLLHHWDFDDNLPFDFDLLTSIINDMDDFDDEVQKYIKMCEGS